MKCPHCLQSFHDDWKTVQLGPDQHAEWLIDQTVCPACGNAIMGLTRVSTSSLYRSVLTVYPKGVARAPLSSDIPAEFASDYKEACLVLADSQKASAALSCRCLQNLLREAAGVKHSTLADEIQQVIDSKKLPSYLADAIDSVRAIGNFAAHPIKSEHSREVIDVEPGEAEWSLDTLEGLFDFYFVQPSKLKRQREDLDQKLAAAGKPPLNKQDP